MFSQEVGSFEVLRYIVFIVFMCLEVWSEMEPVYVRISSPFFSLFFVDKKRVSTVWINN